MIQPLESLESRLLLTVLVRVPGPTLVVRGTDRDDLITLSVKRNDDGRKYLQAFARNRTINYDLTNVHNIQVESLAGPDRIVVDENAVRPMLLNGGLDNDSITAGSGNDTLIGGRGNDALVGGDGNDHFKGYSGNDTLSGNDGHDILDGGEGADLIQGGDGGDLLVGGTGRDQMFGEAGDDLFDSIDGEQDTLNGGSNFNAAEIDDRDVFSDIDELIQA